MSGETLRFVNSRGLKLAGVFHAPAAPVREGLCAVLSHGMLSTKDSRKHSLLAERLAAEGCAAFRFDYSGQGDSEGDPALITYSNGLDDLDAALALLRVRGFRRFVLVGSSMGSGLSILYAGRKPEGIAGLALMASVARIGIFYAAMSEEEQQRWRTEGVYPFQGRPVAFEIVEDGCRHNIRDRLELYTGPVLFIHGTKDELIPIDEVRALMQGHRGRHEFLAIEGADHRLSEEAHRDAAIGTICAWIGRLGA